MAAQITSLEIIETIAQMKGWNANEIFNLDVENETFQKGNGVYMFSLTPKKIMVKNNSVKFLSTASEVEKCIAGA